MNNGQWRIGEAESGMRLDRWLSSNRRLGSNMRALDTLNRGRVVVNGRRQKLKDCERALQPEDVIRLWIDRPIFARAEFESSSFDSLNIVYEDRYVLATNKPAGQLTTPHPFHLEEESLFDVIEDYLARKRRRPYIVHRIDRGTTGLTIVAKTLEAQERLKEQFARREPERIYLAITHGVPAPSDGEWRNRIKWSRSKRHFVVIGEEESQGMDALSFYRVSENFRRAALLEVRLHSGKRNQIRLQAQAAGCPLIGEQVFTDSGLRQSEIPFPRQALHAWRLNFLHPMTGSPINLQAPIPEDILELIEKLRSE
jgi:23S rRNA pseudouridine1911/1915/1917 synthase